MGSPALLRLLLRIHVRYTFGDDILAKGEMICNPTGIDDIPSLTTWIKTKKHHAKVVS